MSGTSLDGLDIALCRFTNDGVWHFELLEATTVDYDEELKSKLRNAGNISSYESIALHREYGAWTGRQVLNFLKNNTTGIDIIASHGHTVFHEPEKKINFQTGDGAMIAAVTGITTISDFRSLDILLGGQGAPLIPVVDRDLFGEYDACVNIGGFANVSLDINNERKAWDICPVNTVLNTFAQLKGYEFDMNGDIGKAGKVINGLLNKLEQLEYYKADPPKSLGTEWLEKYTWPLLRNPEYTTENIMATFYAHAANRISSDLNKHKVRSTLFTGGGVKNSFLMSLIKSKLNHEMIIPDEKIIDYKEALGFAYLGVLRAFELPNCLASVTGARHDSCSGIIHRPK